ncbi:bifunctional protein-disulfide isomerase/oxidoreductase DsbC [Colwellia sp. E2M01]|uniref:bifunctional protein-disulfide isomerase/oxidoreductase DsbC n=1 Tax=Colwellia sp. E2M01 TaxID=2841561 RepID=UPI001C0A2FDD|nr:bifunctional protein-disulfide isomerase/oxidoreductase DsbC [Colwellia sp. E2M01]MBU2871824.1 bifunctional protein-disulfide isomerase/oxidoreductase DsbC [Colwellia sp. E2M01]
MFKTLFLSAVFTTLTLPLLLTSTAVAASSDAPSTIAKPQGSSDKLNVDLLKQKFSTSLGMTVIEVIKTPMPGIASVLTEQGLFYVTFDGNFLIHGKVYGLENGVVDLTESTLAEIRLNGLKAFKDDMIVYKAENEKYVITVFTDITCGYCRKMHGEMKGYNDRGITVQYLAFPRGGLIDKAGNASQGFKDLRSVWCSDDAPKALTDAKLGKGVAYRICESNVEAEYEFGRQIGVTGTPAIILSDGTMVPGYQPPAQLEQMLKTI